MLVVVVAGRSVRNAIACIEGRRDDMRTAEGCRYDGMLGNVDRRLRGAKKLACLLAASNTCMRMVTSPKVCCSCSDAWGRTQI